MSINRNINPQGVRGPQVEKHCYKESDISLFLLLLSVVIYRYSGYTVIVLICYPFMGFRSIDHCSL